MTYLPDGSFIAKIYPGHWYRKNDEPGILVRVIEYKLNDPQRTGHDEVHRLLTNLLDAEQFPAKELIMEYHERWEAESVFDEQKTHQNPCRAEKTTHFRKTKHLTPMRDSTSKQVHLPGRGFRWPEQVRPGR